MGIGNIIGTALGCFICLCFYILIGGVVCPNDIKTRFWRVLCIIFWPIWILSIILSIPYVLVCEFSKTPEESEKDMKEFIKELNR